MAGMYALSSTMSPELPCKSSDVKEVLVLLNRYSPASAQDYPHLKILRRANLSKPSPKKIYKPYAYNFN